MNQHPNPSVDPIRREVTVAVPLERAFVVFVDGFGDWWPREYSWAGEVLEEIGIEPREGGRCSERGPHGFTCDWGRVLTFNPPRRVVFTWQIAPDRTPVPDPAKAGEVEVTFTPEGDGTRITLEHRHFERHGEDAADYRAGLASPQGWPHLLALYAAAAR